MLRRHFTAAVCAAAALLAASGCRTPDAATHLAPRGEASVTVDAPTDIKKAKIAVTVTAKF